jgi:hypothetical protein
MAKYEHDPRSFFSALRRIERLHQPSVSSDPVSDLLPSGVRVLDLRHQLQTRVDISSQCAGEPAPNNSWLPGANYRRETVRAIVRLVRLHEPHVRHSQGNRPRHSLMATAPGGSYDGPLLCAAFKRAAMVSHSAAKLSKTRRPASSESAGASHRQRAAWCNRSASFACFIPTLQNIFRRE